MKYGSLVIEKKEYVLLKRLLNLSGYSKDEIVRRSVRKLINEMDTAQIVDDMEMPHDVVRFNSTVSISSEMGWYKAFQLVFPNERDVKQDKISILTPLGAAIIGYAEGDIVAWDFLDGPKQMRLDRVVQKRKPINISMVF